MRHTTNAVDCGGFRTRSFRVLMLLIGSIVFPHYMLAAEPAVTFVQRPGVLAIRIDDVEVADFVYVDQQVSRPYFAHVKTRSGIQVTRNHPPQKGQDAVDHEGLHTGIWLSFGDLSGCDYWRLKARTQHERFLESPTGGAGNGKFAVLNKYLTTDGKGTVCEETCHYNIRTVAGGYLIEMDSEFRPGDADLVFGDQEEMGLGVRMVTSLAVDRQQGGRILDSAGRKNGKEVWGQTAQWCDYSGPLKDQWVGLTVLSAPENFRPSWSHARDYGFLTVNPFGRNAFTKQEPSRLVIKRGEKFNLRFGVVVHESQTESDYLPLESYRDFVAAKAQQRN